ncbi:hypothetical protein BT69DRAFT_1122627 [Atractiella rhizophila]|nr:hypothetical protein BT69DRAFT_1122627 [Atractiella rhizophila]
METSGFVCKCQRVLGIVYASFMAIVSTIVLLFVPVKLYFHRLLHRLRLPALPSSPQISASQSPLLRSPSLKRKPNFESRQMRVDVLLRDVASDEELHELTTSPLAAESFNTSPTAEDQPVSPISPSGRRSFFGRKKETTSPPKVKDQGSSCSLCSTKSAKGPCRHIKMQQLTLSHAAPDLDGGLSLLPHSSSVPLQQRSFSTPISARPNTRPTRPEFKSVVSAPTPVLKLIPDTPPRTAISLRESLDIPPIIRERSNEDMSPTLTPILASPSISEVPPTPTEEKEKKSKLARCKSKRRSIFSRSSTASSVETAASSSMGTTASSATTFATSLSISPRSSAEGSRSPRHSVDGERLVGKEEKTGLDFSGQSNLSMSHF